MSTGKQVDLFCDQAEALIDVGRPSEAGERLAQALTLDPQSSRALGLMSLVHLRARRHREAAETAHRAIQAAPDDEWGHRILSVALRVGGENKKSIAPAREAVRLAPDSPDALRNLALSLLQTRAFGETREIADRLLALAPSGPDGHEMHGLVAAAQGRKDHAEKHWREALALDPENPTYHNSLALALLEKGEHGEAVERFFGALQNDPKSDLYYENLGIGLEKFRDRSSRYALFFILSFLALGSIVDFGDRMISGSLEDPDEPSIVVHAISTMVWCAIFIAYLRNLIKWRRQHKKVLPLLNAWRPRKTSWSRFPTSVSNTARSPDVMFWLGFLLTLLMAKLAIDNPDRIFLFTIPGAVFLWGLWCWIRRRSRPPVDEEI